MATVFVASSLTYQPVEAESYPHVFTPDLADPETFFGLPKSRKAKSYAIPIINLSNSLFQKVNPVAPGHPFATFSFIFKVMGFSSGSKADVDLWVTI